MREDAPLLAGVELEQRLGGEANLRPSEGDGTLQSVGGGEAHRTDVADVTAQALETGSHQRVHDGGPLAQGGEQPRGAERGREGEEGGGGTRWRPPPSQRKASPAGDSRGTARVWGGEGSAGTSLATTGAAEGACRRDGRNGGHRGNSRHGGKAGTGGPAGMARPDGRAASADGLAPGMGVHDRRRMGVDGASDNRDAWRLVGRGCRGGVRSASAGARSSVAPPTGVRPAASWRVAVTRPPTSAVRQARSRSRSEPEQAGALGEPRAADEHRAVNCVGQEPGHAERGEQRQERSHHPGVHRPPRFPPRPSAWAMRARTLSRSPGRTLPASSR